MVIRSTFLGFHCLIDDLMMVDFLNNLYLRIFAGFDEVMSLVLIVVRVRRNDNRLDVGVVKVLLVLVDVNGLRLLMLLNVNDVSGSGRLEAVRARTVLELKCKTEPFSYFRTIRV